MRDLGLLFWVMGSVLSALSAWLDFAPHSTGSPLGRRPGDLHLEAVRGRVALPMTSCLVLSVILTLISHLFSRWR